MSRDDFSSDNSFLFDDESPSLSGFVDVPVSRYQTIRESTTAKLHRVEAWLAAFFGTLLSLLFIVMVLSIGRLAIVIHPVVLVFGVVALGILIEGPFLMRLWISAWKRDFPIGPAVARRTTTRYMPARLLKIGWWLAHLLTSMSFVVLGEAQWLRQAGNNQLIASALIGLMLFGMSVCCNIFIAVLVKSILASDLAVERFWRWRLVVDVLMAVCALVVSRRL